MIDFQQNLHLVEKFVRHYLARFGQRYGHHKDEITQSARISLWKACQSYDPLHANGATFETFFFKAARYNVRRDLSTLENPISKSERSPQIDFCDLDMNGRKGNPDRGWGSDMSDKVMERTAEQLQHDPTDAIISALEINRLVDAAIEVQATKRKRPSKDGCNTARRNGEIAAYLLTGTASEADMARKFGISRERVRQIKIGFREAWASLGLRVVESEEVEAAA